MPDVLISVLQQAPPFIAVLFVFYFLQRDLIKSNAKEREGGDALLGRLIDLIPKLTSSVDQLVTTVNELETTVEKRNALIEQQGELLKAQNELLQRLTTKIDGLTDIK